MHNHFPAPESIAMYGLLKDEDSVRTALEERRKIPCKGVCSCGFASPVGNMRLTAENDALCACVFTDRLSSEPPYGVLADAVLWLMEYFAGTEPHWTVRTEAAGSPFASAVWSVMRTIPYGKTISYGEICESLAELRPGKKVSARAVGGAVGRNPLAVFWPCHRVVGANGRLTGYAWGLEVKKALLELESRGR